MSSKIQEAKDAIKTGGALHKFVSVSQRKSIEIILRGEEAAWMAETVIEAAKCVAGMPKTYETDGQGMEALVHLHYFRGGMDAWVSEKDKGDGIGEERQLQAFGAINLGHGAELGYINIEELLFNNFELDLHWTKKPLKAVMK